MKFGLTQDATKPNLYRIIRERLPDARKILEPFDLAIELDDVRGIAFLKIADVVNKDPDEAWSHPLVRRQRLTSEQSLLVAILRQAYIAYEQEYGLGADGARIDFDELQTQFDTYFGNSGSEAGDRERLSRVITQLHSHSIVSEPDKKTRYVSVQSLCIWPIPNSCVHCFVTSKRSQSPIRSISQKPLMKRLPPTRLEPNGN